MANVHHFHKKPITVQNINIKNYMDEKHNLRLGSSKNRPNVDPNGPPPQVIIGSQHIDLRAAIYSLLDRCKIPRLGATNVIREDQYRMCKTTILERQLILSAEHEYFAIEGKEGRYHREWDESKVQRWVDQSVRYLNVAFEGRCVRAILHLDELAPHIHCYIVPLIRYTYRKDKNKGGKRYKCKIQEGFWKVFADDYFSRHYRYWQRLAWTIYSEIGVTPSLPGSKATHGELSSSGTRIREERRALTQDAENLSLEREVLETEKKSIERQKEAINDKQKALSAALNVFRPLDLDEFFRRIGWGIFFRQVDVQV